MPLNESDIVTTVGSASATSYVSLSEFSTYRDRKKLAADGFDSAEPDQKIRALLITFDRLNQESWKGVKVTMTQAGAWPRYGVAKLDSGGYGSYWGYDVSGATEYSSTEIPQQVKDAQCEMAIAMLESIPAPGQQSNRWIKKWQADDVAIEYGDSGGGQGTQPQEVTSLISGLILGPRLVRA